MGMKVSAENFLGTDEVLKPSAETVASKMALDFESQVFLRMKEIGLKQKDLAELMGISPAAVSKMLSNSSNLTLKTISKIAVALGCVVGPITLEAFDADGSALPKALQSQCSSNSCDGSDAA